MPDIMTPAERSQRMRLIKGKNTKPEMRVRQLIHSMGYRYRLHPSNLPGKPDIVFPSRRKIILVHGCFWHMHEGCRINKPPKSRLDYWLPKLHGNVERDKTHRLKLREMGWDVMVIWECETEKVNNLVQPIREFLGPSARELQ